VTSPVTRFEGWSLPRGVEVTATRDIPVRRTVGLNREAAVLLQPEIDPGWMGHLLDRLASARAELLERTAESIVDSLGRVGERFLDPDDALRQEALALLPGFAGQSEAMAERVLDGMATDWTHTRLRELLEHEVGGSEQLDIGHAWSEGPRAFGPDLTVQILAGSVPGVTVSALIRTLLVKSPTLIKPGLGDAVLPTLFARGLRAEDPALADALGVLYWSGGSVDVERVALSRADLVVVYGSDEVVESMRARVRSDQRFIGYGHRISIGVVGQAALVREQVYRTAEDVAEAVALFDRRGCVSPQIVYVESGGDSTPRDFADHLADAMQSVQERLPAGALDAAEASSMQQARGIAELLAASSPGVWVRHGGRTPWTVVLAGAESVVPNGGGRFLRVEPVTSLADVPERVRPIRAHLQTVGTAGVDHAHAEAMDDLARVGVSRIVPFRSMAFPPPWWHHDGRGPLTPLLHWVDRECE